MRILYVYEIQDDVEVYYEYSIPDDRDISELDKLIDIVHPNWIRIEYVVSK